jgi:hypothetical protein
VGGSWRGVRGVVEGVVSGLLRSEGEGREPRTPQFSNQIDATEWKEGKIEGWRQERKVRDGRDGRSPFHKLILDTPLTVQRTPDRG